MFPILLRIIPADAGNTIRRTPPSVQGRDHPRGCGEHQPCHFLLRDLRGSSPRMRGTLQGQGACHDLPGIIPADAGNTRICVRISKSSQDHPRGCGEHQSTGRLKDGSSGSSPRMRGTPPGAAAEAAKARIIPADAGNTIRRMTCGMGAGDHPRGCGEPVGGLRGRATLRGSSPRMRGTHTMG